MRLVIFSILFGIISLLPMQAKAADVSINWQAPTENIDGTPLTDLAAFKVYIGTESRNYTQTISINDPSRTSATATITLPVNPGENTFYIAMTAIDDDGNESGYSNEITRVISAVDDIAPMPPVIITVTVTVDVDCPSGFTCNSN